MNDGILASQEDLDAFIQAFLAGTFPKAEWRHRQHVIMAAWHLLHYTEAEAIPLVRDRIRRYNESQGTINSDSSGYHETLTIFWLRVIADARARQPSGMTELDRVRVLADEFGPRGGLFKDYYSFNVIQAVPARLGWIVPDLKPLPPKEPRPINESLLASPASLESFIAAFLDCTFPGNLWHHREHIIMAGWHLLRYSEAETIAQTREAIKRYRLARGGANDATSGYHETLTVFWIRLTGVALARHSDTTDEVTRLCAVADELGPKTRLYFDYYSYDVLNSTPARLQWMEPDLKPLPALPLPSSVAK